MIIFKHSNDLQLHLQNIKKNKQTIGFVPTMGALHGGHLSLISQSKNHADITVCSIFVNPVQFNNAKDFERYPISTEHDILLLSESNCDILFLPGENDIYPDESSKNKHFDIGYLETTLEGKFRPGHFQGVCMVVEKLINIVDPTYLFLGRKDYQQSLVIKRLLALMKKNVIIKICPTLREPNGLAMSSRNARLTSEEKDKAAELHQALVNINNEITLQTFNVLKNREKARLEKLGFKIDYLEIATTDHLQIDKYYNDHDEFVILIAAYLQDVRLIDNVPVTT
ncbi:MAG: pantoate--beta-alanine ligase [Ginsengibacter sp.]